MGHESFGDRSLTEPENPDEFSLEGEISQHSLEEVFQLLDLGKKSGILSVEFGFPAGIVQFEKGLITFAHSLVQEGREAALEILSLERGVFRFFPREEMLESNCRITAGHLLLLWAARTDELARV